MDSAKPMVTEMALMGHKTRQSCDHGKEICKEEVGMEAGSNERKGRLGKE